MTAIQSAAHSKRGPSARKRGPARLGLTLFILGAVAIAAVASVAFILWPRWPAAITTTDAPSLPVTIGNVAFNVPPAAIRMEMQRRPGAHERVDLVFLWPSLDPPDPAHLVQPVTSDAQADQPQLSDRLFVTLSVNDGTMPPQERIRTIYPRYLAPALGAGPGGLAMQSFRDGTPYQGEDLIFDAGRPEAFAFRCSRMGVVGSPGMCLYERRIDTADIVVRFPRTWLQTGGLDVAGRIDGLIARLRGKGA